jgi:hypothetical protein
VCKVCFTDVAMPMNNVEQNDIGKAMLTQVNTVPWSSVDTRRKSELLAL